MKITKKAGPIVYASADLNGCTIETERGITRSRSWRTIHAENSKVTHVVTGNSTKSARWTNAAFIIVTEANPRDYSRALSELMRENYTRTAVVTERGTEYRYTLRAGCKEISTSRLALRIQKIERANARTTKEPESENRADESQYDGFVISRRERQEMTYSTSKGIDELTSDDLENEASFNWSQARGILKRGRRDNIRRLPAIPSLRLCKLEPSFMPLREMLKRERELNERLPRARVYGPIHPTYYLFNECSPRQYVPKSYTRAGGVVRKVYPFNNPTNRGHVMPEYALPHRIPR